MQDTLIPRPSVLVVVPLLCIFRIVSGYFCTGAS
jgi:hypothetical protein